MVFCWPISTYRTAAPSRTPPAAGNPNNARAATAPASSLISPAALPKNSTSPSTFASTGTVASI